MLYVGTTQNRLQTQFCLCEFILYKIYIYRVILTSVLKILFKNSVKESFYKKKNNILTIFFIFHKNDVKIFFNCVLN